MAIVHRRTIISTIKELNEILGLSPPIEVPRNVTRMLADLKEAVKLVDPNDVFSSSTEKLVNALLENEEITVVTNKQSPVKDPNDLPTVTEALENPSAFGMEVDEDLAHSPLLPIEGDLISRRGRMSDAMDQVMIEGGSWESIIEKIRAAAELLGRNPEVYRRSHIRRHIANRIAKGFVDYPFVGTRHIVVNDDGVFVTRKEERKRSGK